MSGRVRQSPRSNPALIEALESRELFSGAGFTLTVPQHTVAALRQSPAVQVASIKMQDTLAVAAPPTDLVARAEAGDRVQLTWTDPSGTADGFHVYRWNGVWWGLVGSVGGDARSLTDTEVQPGHRYYYQVTSFTFDSETWSNQTAVVDTPVIEPPGPVVGLTATALAPDSVLLSWRHPSADAETFYIYRWNGVWWHEVGAVDGNVRSFEDNSVVPGTYYSYQVTAANLAGETWALAGAEVETPVFLEPPGPVVDLSADPISPDQIELRWSHPSEDAAGFHIYRWDGTWWQAVGTVDGESRSFVDDSVDPFEQHIYQVTSFNAAGETWSAGSVIVNT